MPLPGTPLLASGSFSKAIFLGAGLVAIVSGLVGNLLVEDLRLGAVAPFDAAIVVLLVGGAVVLATWGENYGDAHNSRSLGAQLALGWQAIRTGEALPPPPPPGWGGLGAVGGGRVLRESGHRGNIRRAPPPECGGGGGGVRGAPSLTR